MVFSNPSPSPCVTLQSAASREIELEQRVTEGVSAMSRMQVRNPGMHADQHLSLQLS